MMPAAEEEDAGQRIAKFASLVASCCAWIATVLGICAIFLPWWTGAAAGEVLGFSTSLEGSITLWNYDLKIEVPISADSPDMHAVQRDEGWSKWCKQEEENRREWPSECVQLECTRAFTVLAPIFALLSAVAALIGMFEPLVLLIAAFCSFIGGLSAAVGFICALLIGTSGLTAPGGMLLIAACVLIVLAFLLDVYAAQRAMPLEGDGKVQRQSGGRLLKLRAAKTEELQLMQHLASRNPRVTIVEPHEEKGDAVSVDHSSHHSSRSGTHEDGNAASLGETEVGVHVPSLKKAIEWSHSHGSDESEQIPVNLLEKAFREMDADASGSIDLDELVRALVSCGLPASREATEKILGEIDKNQSGDIDILEFVGFFRHIEEMNRFAKKNQSRARFITLACSCCFLTHVVLVGTLLMLFINMDEAENPDNYIIMKNLLIVCSLTLGVLFCVVIAVPALNLTLGQSMVAWRQHYDKRFRIDKNKFRGGAKMSCEYGCGFQGNFEEVTAHEKICEKGYASGAPAHGQSPDGAGGPRQAGAGESPVGTPVNAAVYGASYRVRKVQRELALQTFRECPFGCGFTGRADELAGHADVCQLAKPGVVASPAAAAAVATTAGAPLSVSQGLIVDEDGGTRYDPNAFRQQHTNQAQRPPPQSFSTMGGRDTRQMPAAADRPPMTNTGLLAIDNGASPTGFGTVRPNPNF